MSIVEIIVDLIPVGLAIIALISLSKSFSSVRRSTDKIIYICASIAASIMLVAQLSWWSSNVFENRLVDLSFANYLWTAFNSLTMIVFILISRKREKDECKDCKNTA